MTDNPRTRALLHHLATRPGHDEVKSDFRQLLVEEFGVELGMKPEPKFLKAGDVVTLGIEEPGEQRQKIVKFKM